MEIETWVGVLAWPVGLFVFSVIFIFVFREPLSGPVSRIKKVTKKGITVAPSPETQKTETSGEAVQKLLDFVGISVVITDRESKIRQDLRQA